MSLLSFSFVLMLLLADAMGNSLWLSQQEPTLWTHELDLRPAQEKF